MSPFILVVGSINMDLIVRCRQVPRPGETVHGEELVTAPGGKGANQAVASSRLGARTAMVGRLGNDDFGRALRAGLQAEGVDVSGVRADLGAALRQAQGRPCRDRKGHPEPSRGAASGVALILLEASGGNRIIVIGGANLRVDDEDVAVARELLRKADALLMQLEIPLAAVEAIARAARERAVLTVLDAGAATPAAARADLLGLMDVVSPNEIEAEALTGIRVQDERDARRAAERLRERGARDVVVKLGAHGAYWLGSGGEGLFPAFEIQPVDTTAAGDAFTAALTVGLASGLTMPEAVRRANAAGALACLKLGAQPSMPTAAAVDDFLRTRAEA